MRRTPRPDRFRPLLDLKQGTFMALNEVQQRDLFVKVAGALMVCLLLYGALSLAGVVH